jgi:hypothetical protein
MLREQPRIIAIVEYGTKVSYAFILVDTETSHAVALRKRDEKPEFARRHRTIDVQVDITGIAEFEFFPSAV